MKISHENDGTVKLLDTATGACLEPIDIELGDLVTLESHNKLAVLPDGRLASAP